jgi:hypothetical protein
MKLLRLAALAFLIAGCATRPSPPPDCDGELVPINPVTSMSSPGVNDAARPRS